MSSERRFDRRALILVGVAGAAALVGARRWWLDDDREPALDFTRNALAFLPDVGAAAAVGHAYLREHPREAGEVHLARLLEASHPRWRELRTRANRGLALRLARESAHGDYAAGRVVLVDGWYLSRTEARLCGLATYA